MQNRFLSFSLLIFLLAFAVSCEKNNVKNKAMLYPNIFFVEALHNRKEISLTFDDGPDKKYTILVLKILKKYNVKATFFMTGKRIKKYSKILKIIDKEGHLIGNHTVNHLKEHSFSIIDSMDWHPKFKNVKNISNQIMGNIHSGAIIIMHDACNQNCVNVRVLDDMIPKLKKLGYKFVTVETLLGIKGKL